jgi:glycosyltransferase involved in cell wall biosynthesis
LLAAVWSQRSGRPLLLTEHGIYVRERALELSRASWSATDTSPAIHALWLRYFHALARCTYARAESIISLSEGHRLYQIADGAPRDRTLVTPNGIDADAFAARLGAPRRPHRGPARIGFVGRVVPIKDVVTFLHACALARTEVELDVHVIGPADEDRTYADRCHRLAADLGLEETVHFDGARPLEQIYPELDMVVLTSFSEGQPLVILEASAAGLPVIASDVGACRELIVGSADLDRQLGPSGIVTRLADPEQTAAAIVQLARDPQLRARMGAAGQRRVRTYYRHSATVASYRNLYGGTAWPESAGDSSG